MAGCAHIRVALMPLSLRKRPIDESARSPRGRMRISAADGVARLAALAPHTRIESSHQGCLARRSIC